MELAAVIVAIIFGLVGALFGFLGWRKAGEANRIAAASNTIAQESKTIAEDSNRIALEANDIAREANTITTGDIDYQRRKEWEANRAELVVPEDGPIWVYNMKNGVARVGVHLEKKGTGEVRDFEMAAFVDESPLRVEKGRINRLTQDDQPGRLLFQIPIDDSWASPETRLIRVQLNFTDGTGPREESHCFRFRGDEPQTWKSEKVPCT